VVKLNGLESLTLEYLRNILGDEIEIIAQDMYLPGSPDFVIERLKLCLQIDGLWWHNSRAKMTTYGVRQVASGRANGSFWLLKAEENRKRDRLTTAKLKDLGYRVVRLKEERLRARNGQEYVSRALGLALTRGLV
jgi:DNA mismatch endonuclease Vsr